MDNKMGLKDIFKLVLECPAEYASITFNISSNITAYFTLSNFLVFIIWFILRKVNNKKMNSRSTADEMDDIDVRNKYLLFMYRLTSIYLLLLLIFIFYGIFFLDKSCWYKYY